MCKKWRCYLPKLSSLHFAIKDVREDPNCELTLRKIMKIIIIIIIITIVKYQHWMKLHFHSSS